MYSMDYMYFGNSTDRLWDRAKVEVVKINQIKIICPPWPDGSPEEKHDFSWTADLARQKINFSTFIEETILDSMWLIPSKANFLRWSWMICQCQTLKMLLNIHIYSILSFFFSHWHYVLMNPFPPHCGLLWPETGFRPSCPYAVCLWQPTVDG